MTTTPITPATLMTTHHTLTRTEPNADLAATLPTGRLGDPREQLAEQEQRENAPGGGR